MKFLYWHKIPVEVYANTILRNEGKIRIIWTTIQRNKNRKTEEFGILKESNVVMKAEIQNLAASAIYSIQIQYSIFNNWPSFLVHFP